MNPHKGPPIDVRAEGGSSSANCTSSGDARTMGNVNQSQEQWRPPQKPATAASASSSSVPSKGAAAMHDRDASMTPDERSRIDTLNVNPPPHKRPSSDIPAFWELREQRRIQKMMGNSVNGGNNSKNNNSNNIQNAEQQKPRASPSSSPQRVRRIRSSNPYAAEQNILQQNDRGFTRTNSQRRQGMNRYSCDPFLLGEHAESPPSSDNNSSRSKSAQPPAQEQQRILKRTNSPRRHGMNRYSCDQSLLTQSSRVAPNIANIADSSSALRSITQQNSPSSPSAWQAVITSQNNASGASVRPNNRQSSDRSLTNLSGHSISSKPMPVIEESRHPDKDIDNQHSDEDDDDDDNDHDSMERRRSSEGLDSDTLSMLVEKANARVSRRSFIRVAARRASRIFQENQTGSSMGIQEDRRRISRIGQAEQKDDSLDKGADPRAAQLPLDASLRPGAYAKAPGQDFKRLRPFDRQNLSTRNLYQFRSDAMSTVSSATTDRNDGENLDRKPPARDLNVARDNSTSSLSSTRHHIDAFNNCHSGSSRDVAAGDRQSILLSELTLGDSCHCPLDTSEHDVVERGMSNIRRIVRESIKLNLARSSISQSSSESGRSAGTRVSGVLSGLPIAAEVVPSDEDLELTIRSRVEMELRQKLHLEMAAFRRQYMDMSIVDQQAVATSSWTLTSGENADALPSLRDVEIGLGILTAEASAPDYSDVPQIPMVDTTHNSLASHHDVPLAAVRFTSDTDQQAPELSHLEQIRSRQLTRAVTAMFLMKQKSQKRNSIKEDLADGFAGTRVIMAPYFLALVILTAFLLGNLTGIPIGASVACRGP